jgi:hypothetical protein
LDLQSVAEAARRAAASGQAAGTPAYADPASTNPASDVRSGPVALDRIVAVGLELRPAPSPAGTANDAPADPPSTVVRTDSWRLLTSYHPYIGQRLGLPDTFYVQRDGLRLAVGRVGHFELVFHRRATGVLGTPWLEIRQGRSGQRVVGAPATGLWLLDQDALDALNPSLGAAALTPATTLPAATRAATGPTDAGPRSTFTWELAWSSPKAAAVEVTQTTGPFDRMGRPAMETHWRFVIYQTGQVYMNLSWTRPAEWDTDAAADERGIASPQRRLGLPVALALGLPAALCQAPASTPERLLSGLYLGTPPPAPLPHALQLGRPLALLGKFSGHENLWFRASWRSAAAREGASADAPDVELLGQGIPVTDRQGPICALLLADLARPLDVAANFSAYLTPPALEIKRGDLDRNFPGDIDNDGLVDGAGFMTLRLEPAAGGTTTARAAWTIDPGNRPIYFPAFLLTLPAPSTGPSTAPAPGSSTPPSGVTRSRASLDPAPLRLRVIVDGQQLSDPPRWPDGSFLVQLPWIISRPVHIEAETLPPH